MILPLVYLAVGLVFLGCSLYELALLVRCRAACEGICVGAVTYGGSTRTAWRRSDPPSERGTGDGPKPAATCSPVFRYTYGGKTYERAAFQGFSGRYAARAFPKNARRTLWVDPAHPEHFAVQRTPQPGTLLALAGGVAFAALAVYCLM